jgi:hypothetical protein
MRSTWYRDIKPENILLYEGEAMAPTSASPSHRVMPRPTASPLMDWPGTRTTWSEQASGVKPGRPQRCLLLACMLYELLTGAALYRSRRGDRKRFTDHPRPGGSDRRCRLR